MRGTTPQQRAKSLTTVLNKTYDPYGKRCNIIDVLTDLRHLCDVNGWDFADLDRQAYDHYTTEKAVDAAVKDAIRNKYAWPGGYPLFLITTDGGAVCLDCGRKEYKQIAYAVRHSLNDGWNVAAVDVNWEDPDLYCDHCSEKIESAYAS